MPGKAWMVLALLLQGVPLSGAIAGDMPLQAVGRAYDEGGEKLLYSEYHFCGSEQACTIEYRKPDGELIALKQLDYSYGSHSPALVIMDYRNGTEASVASGGREGVVIDAGFDNYVRSRWSELAGGKSIEFPFQVVGFDKPLPMKAYRAGREDCASQSLCLEVSLDSWLMSMFVDPIALDYARDSQRLLRFRGISNLRDAGGKTFQVDIRYEYMADANQTAVKTIQ